MLPTRRGRMPHSARTISTVDHGPCNQGHAKSAESGANCAPRGSIHVRDLRGWPQRFANVSMEVTVKLALVDLKLLAGVALSIATFSSLGIGCGEPSNKTATLTTDAATTGCRSSSDCTSQPDGLLLCVGPDELYACGPVEQVGSACYGDMECGRGSVCRETSAVDAGPSSSGKVCTDASCTDDSHCSGGQVCRKDRNIRIGDLNPGGIVCAPPCIADVDCAATDKCESAGHCRARTCAECPSYFSCASGTCIIPSCSRDADCRGGYCVNKSCAGSLGNCRLFCL